MDAIIQSLTSRYNAEYAPESTNRTIPPATTLTIAVNSRDPWIPYLYKIGGYCTSQSLASSFLDGRGVSRYSWTAWPDTNRDFSMTPLVPNYRLKEQGTYNSVVGNFFLVFVNSSEDNVDLNLSLEMFLIDEAQVDSFEAEFKALSQSKAVTAEIRAEGFSGPASEEQNWKKRISSI